MTDQYPALFDDRIGPALARRLLAAVIVQAVKDGRRLPRKAADHNRRQFARYADDAIAWLNHPNAAALAAAINIALPERVTGELLRGEAGQ